jgi:hypothetical protein
MTPQDFAYWLKGFFELTNTKRLSETQVAMISEHLDLVFNKKTSDSDVLEENIRLKKELEATKKELELERMKGNKHPAVPPFNPSPFPNIPMPWEPTITCRTGDERIC